MSALLRRAGFLPRTSILCRLQSSQTPAELAEAEDSAIAVLADEQQLEQASNLELSRNKSRLSSSHFNLVNGRMPYSEPIRDFHKTVKYNRKLYGKYGEASGVDPSICWPSIEDLNLSKEHENIAHPFTIQEMAAQVRKKREDEKRAIREREDEIAAKLEKLAQWKIDLNNKQMKKMEAAKAAKEKKERLVEEVRRHFGFKLDHRDERFQEMLAKREKEQKKQDKMVKRDAKEKEMLAKIQAKNTAIEASTEK